ncbi:MAG: LacI family DNA-binding transcriptional regulator, partial [Candidatus Cryptobacteroides sp.]
MEKKSMISSKVTIRDVAEAAGVSVSLVSFVLNARRGPNGEYLCSASDETAKRIAAVADRLGYHRNLAASTLRSGHSDTIGVIVADISNTFFGDICRKVENISARNGILSLFGSTDDDPAKLEQIITKFISSGVDGLIIAPCSHSEPVISRLAKNVPVVLIDRDLPQMQG